MQTISHDLCTAQWGRYHCVIILQVRKYHCGTEGCLRDVGEARIHLSPSGPKACDHKHVS